MTKDTMLTYSKYVLFGAALIPYLVIASVMFPLLPWSWRIGAFLPILLVPVWGGLVLLKRAFSRNEQSDDEGTQERLKELQNNWQKGIRALKGSQLKDQGDPLYVLPWYLVIGESGSGKSAAIRGSKVSSPFAEEAPTAQSATRTCAWRFYDQGVLIDTAGRYTVPLESERDHREWQRLLSLIAWTRRREPINGVIVTVAADRLVGGSVADLEEYGRQVRSRLEEMMQELRANFPVYLLVTKCDLLQGMTSFFAGLPQEAADQPMGLLNREKDGDLQGFLGRLSTSLSRRLRDLRLHMLHRPECPDPGSPVLLFPDLMRNLLPGIEAFATAAFGKNLYQETPLLRGVYFSSAGADRVEISNESEGPRPLFLHDLFEKVLPRDRFMQCPTAKARRWRCRAQRAAFFSWILLSLSFSVLLTCSFFKNVAVLKDATALVGRNAELRGEAGADIAAMEKTAALIGGIEEANRGWWIPRLGLNRSVQIEEALKERFCRRFRDRFLSFFDRELAGAVDQFTLLTPNDLFGRYVMHLSRRINLLQGRLEGNPAPPSVPLPDYLPAAQGNGGTGFGNLYRTYLSWHSDRDQLAGELQRLQALLKQAFLARGTDLSWLLEYVDRHEPQAAIQLQQFWGGSGVVAAGPAIAPSFTRKGKQRLNALLNEIETAYPDPGVLEREKGSFSAWYRNACFAAWQKFIWQLPKGEQHLAGPREWRTAAANMAGEKGAYFLFMQKAAMELEAFTTGESLPLWVAELYRFQALKKSGGAPRVASNGDGKKIAGTVGRLFSKEGGTPSAIAGTDVAREYLAAMEKIAPVARSRTLAHRMAEQAFVESAEAEKSPLFEAADAAQRLNTLLAQGEGDETFSRLITGPISFYGTFIRMETACAIQTQWEEKVLKELQGADPQALQYLLGKDGPVWKFVGSVADPFLGWSPARGYYAKSALGGAVPFKPEFYSFLAKGAKAKIMATAPPRPSYQVTIRGLPTDANTEARIKPHGTHLELQCATGTQVISNLNYPVSKSFVWSPGTCGDVTFQIDIGDTVLTKRYTGMNGFPEFLRDFRGGRRTFYTAQFPGEKQALERMGVRFIRVNYQLVGGDDIVSGSPRPFQGRVPAKITDCWD